MEPPAFKTHVVASALIRRGDEILLVHQHRPADPYPNWYLPGGRIEAGELLNDGLIREVREEAGLEVKALGQLAYAMQAVGPAGEGQAIAYVFEVAEWSGTPAPSDPDGVVSEARWFGVADALEHLQSVPWHSMREPLVAYLRGEHAPGIVWLYAVRSGGADPYATLAATLPPFAQDK